MKQDSVYFLERQPGTEREVALGAGSRFPAKERLCPRRVLPKHPQALEDEFGERFVRIHRNCLVARHEITELKRSPDGHVQAVLRHGKQPLEVSRRCVSNLRETVKHL